MCVCLLGAVNKTGLRTNKLPLLKDCWEFGNKVLLPFRDLRLNLMTDFPQSFPEFYPVKKMFSFEQVHLYGLFNVYFAIS